MAWIPFVRRDLQRLIDREAEIRVDLNDAARAAEVTRKGAPRSVVDELERGLLAWRKRDLRQRRAAASVERRRHDRLKTLGRDGEARRECGIPIDQPSA